MKFLTYFRVLIFGLFSVCLFGMKSNVLQDKKELSFEQSVEKFVEDAMNVYHVPGCSVAIVKDGKVFYTKGFGYRDIENKKPVTPETIFAIGSCTKAFTATAIEALVKQNKLDWDVPIKKYLPDFEMYDKETSEKLSLRDCLCHRSGLPCYDCLWNRFKSRKELIDNLRYLKTSAKLGEKYQYNNLMYTLAGYVLEKVSGISWESVVQKYITEPLDMKETYCSLDNVPFDKNAALAYEFDEKNQSFKHVDYFNIDLIGPAGSICSNVTDLAKWVIMNLQDKELVNEVHKKQMLMEPGEEPYYCFGWFRAPLGGDEFVIHRGGMRGCSSLVAFVPKQQIGFVVLSNKEEDDSEFVTLITKYIHALFTNNTTGVQKWEKSLLDVETKEKETSSNKNQEFQKITPQLASLFAGTYHNDIFGDLVITAGGSALSFTYIDETLDLMCIDNNTFKDKENWEFRFKRNNLDLPDRFDVEIEKGCSYEFVKIK